MIGNENLLSSSSEHNFGEVKVRDGKSYKISGVGQVEFKTKKKKRNLIFFLDLLCSWTKKKLLIVAHLLRKDYDIHLCDMACSFSKKKSLITRIVIASNSLLSATLQNRKLSCFLGIEKGVSEVGHDKITWISLEMLSRKMMVRGLPK